jgi:hypothetical protein
LYTSKSNQTPQLHQPIKLKLYQQAKCIRAIIIC